MRFGPQNLLLGRIIGWISVGVAGIRNLRYRDRMWTRTLTGFAALAMATGVHAGPKKALKHAPVVQPAVNAADIPVLAGLLDKAGWTATPELSGVFQVGRIFKDDGFGHSLMVRDCFSTEVGSDPYTSAEVVNHLEAGVQVGFGIQASASAAMVRTVRFEQPVHHTLARLAMVPTAECTAMLTSASAGERSTMYAVQEVLTAVITEQRCGTLDANGRFVAASAEMSLERSCSQTSEEPVAVAYRSVAVADLMPGAVAPQTVLLTPPARSVGSPTEPVSEACHWGPIQSVHSTMTTLTINGQMMDVRGLNNRAWIATEMQRCGYPDAAEAFNAWREARRTTNISCATGIGCYPLGVGIWSATKAKKHRLRMESALMQSGMVASEP